MPTITHPSVETLERLVAYQDGAVVSRMLLKQKGGNVSLFAFDQGESLSEHTVPFDALVVVVDGTAEIEIDGTPHRVQAGETITLPADVPHAVRAPERFKMLLIMVRT